MKHYISNSTKSTVRHAFHPSKNLVIGSIAVLAIAGALFLLLQKSPDEKAEQRSANTSRALGQRAAEEVAQLLGNKGQIAVYSLEIGPRKIPRFAEEMTIFEQTLNKHGVKIAATEAMPGGLNMLMLGARPSPKDYEELLDQAPGASAVVSFVGPPNLSLEDFQKLQAHRPPLIVVNTFVVTSQAALSAMIEAKAVALAFVPLTPSEIESEKQQPKLFDRSYKILRAP